MNFRAFLRAIVGLLELPVLLLSTVGYCALIGGLVAAAIAIIFGAPVVGVLMALEFFDVIDGVSWL